MRAQRNYDAAVGAVVDFWVGEKNIKLTFFQIYVCTKAQPIVQMQSMTPLTLKFLNMFY